MKTLYQEANLLDSDMVFRQIQSRSVGRPVLASNLGSVRISSEEMGSGPGRYGPEIRQGMPIPRRAESRQEEETSTLYSRGFHAAEKGQVHD